MVDDSASARLVVLDDAGLGFRADAESWPLAIRDARRRPWVLLKMARPVARGALYGQLVAHHAERLIVVMTADDLRGSDVEISRGLSWERTVEDLAWELVHNQSVNSLANCRCVVVSFGPAGALVLLGGREESFQLVFDPAVMEGEWGGRHPGNAIGFTSSMTAALAASVMKSSASPDLFLGAQRGLAAMRRLQVEGYPGMRFPVDEVVDEILDPARPFAVAPDPERTGGSRSMPIGAIGGGSSWRILHDHYPEGLERVAEQVVRFGIEKQLRGVPLGRFGKLVTVDRGEIEGLRAVRRLIAEYAKGGRRKRPLSLAVFGAPGSGKSFGIVQVAESVLPGVVERKTFNLSQFRSRDDLLSALHQVRDITLSGKLPLVFWDEFDSLLDGRPLGWLAYFLAPMQDGEFQQGQLTHSIGPAVFVFAGGTSHAMESFGSALAPEDPLRNERLFVEAKGPDFVSRLKGFVDMLGPDPRGGNRSEDPFFVVRRAILLRALLYERAPTLFEGEARDGRVEIDAGVLRALLQVERYRHGARSMEAVLAMSSLEGRTAFERSDLPPVPQLELHVEAQDFLLKMRETTLTEEQIERLAQVAHQIFVASRRRDGWRYGPEKSERERTHPLLVSWNELPERHREANRTTVLTIPKKLAAVGLVMTPARGEEQPHRFSEQELERLSRLEHELWMEAKLASGWQLGEPTPSDPKRNEYLRPWSEIPEEIRRVDRDLVAGIPEILRRAGYTIVRPRRGIPPGGDEADAAE